jgi:hypothetical protein
VLAMVLQKFMGKNHLVKRLLISTLNKAIYSKGTMDYVKRAIDLKFH